jgi:hypothetical protein
MTETTSVEVVSSEVADTAHTTDQRNSLFLEVLAARRSVLSPAEIDQVSVVAREGRISSVQAVDTGPIRREELLDALAEFHRRLAAIQEEFDPRAREILAANLQTLYE